MIREGNAGEMREAEGQDAEHGGRQGSNLPGSGFPRMPLMWRMDIVCGVRIGWNISYSSV